LESLIIGTCIHWQRKRHWKRHWKRCCKKCYRVGEPWYYILLWVRDQQNQQKPYEKTPRVNNLFKVVGGILALSVLVVAVMYQK